MRRHDLNFTCLCFIVYTDSSKTTARHDFLAGIAMPAEAYRTASFKKKKQPRTILTTVQGKATGRTDTDSTAALLKYRKSSAPDPASVYHLTIL